MAELAGDTPKQQTVDIIFDHPNVSEGN